MSQAAYLTHVATLDLHQPLPLILAHMAFLNSFNLKHLGATHCLLHKCQIKQVIYLSYCELKQKRIAALRQTLELYLKAI